jgi:hypothetical protein
MDQLLFVTEINFGAEIINLNFDYI